MSDIIFETLLYEIKVGKSTFDDLSVDCYKVINKETEVVEAEASVLAQAIQYAKNFTEKLEEELEVKEPLQFAH